MNQPHIAQKSPYPVKIEAGKNQNPTLDTLKNIAKVLEISVDDLIK